MHNTALDSLVFEKFDFPYNRVENQLSEMPRFVSGYNTYVSVGGTLNKRPGTIALPNSQKSGYRVDRLWNYETLEISPKVYIVASLYNLSSAMWELWYYRPSSHAVTFPNAANPSWIQVPNYRQVNNSSAPHEANVFKGLLYVKGFPTAASGEKLGTIIFDGSTNTPTTKPWGILPPTIPAALAGAVATLSVSGIDASSGTLNTYGPITGFSIPPFNIQVDFEYMTVTAYTIGGTSFIVTRGVNGTTAVAHSGLTTAVWRNWDTSLHQVNVNIGWGYTYAYKSITGNYSNRAPLETNVDKLPSRTGPFQNLIPKFSIQGIPDITNFPKIGIFRTTDGGGTYFFLEDIVNTGNNITYEDKNFQSGLLSSFFKDPVPDELLNTGVIAPTLTSNSPPPTVISPQVTGTDTPISSTPIASFAARQWYGVGNILFYSGNEEISTGIPEECFPSGTFGNFYRFANPVLNVAPTSNYLYTFTSKNIEQTSGTNKETFNTRPIFDNIGYPYSHPRAITRFGEVIAFLTQDLRIGFIQNGNITIISDPLSTDISDGNLTGLEYDLKYFADNEKELLFVSGHDRSNSTLSTQWLYDIKKSSKLGEIFWQLPWKMKITATYSDRIYENSTQRKFVVSHFDGSQCNLAYVDMSLLTATDDYLGVSTGYTFDAKTHLMSVPVGNHVNVRRAPGITPVFYAVSLDCTAFTQYSEPILNYYLDDFWTQPIPFIQSEIPPRRKPSVGYNTIMWLADKVGQRVAFEITKISPTTDRFEAQGMVVTYAPDLGA